MAKPTHDEAGVPLPAGPPVLKEDHPNLTYTHDKGGSPIGPFTEAQDIEQPVEWKVGDETIADAARVNEALSDARSAAQARGDDPDDVSVKVTKSAVTHDAQGRPKPAFAEGATDEPSDVDPVPTVLELNSQIRTLRGQRDRIDSQENASKRVRSEAAHKSQGTDREAK